MLNIRQVGVVGYGCCGRPMALNLRDGAIEVLVGESDDEQALQAMRDGFPNFSPAEVVTRSELLVVDTASLAGQQRDILDRKYLAQSSTLLFISSDGPNSFHLPQSLPNDIAWLRPSCSGDELRAAFLSGELATVEFIEVQDHSGSLSDTVEALTRMLMVTPNKSNWQDR